jgi:hypothetical protein
LMTGASLGCVDGRNAVVDDNDAAIRKRVTV